MVYEVCTFQALRKPLDPTAFIDELRQQMGAELHALHIGLEANYTDSHGQSEIGFGITQLLGFDLLPRIKRINHVKLYRPAPGEALAWPAWRQR